MPDILVRDLCARYQRHSRAPGFRNAVRDLFRRNYVVVPALEDVSFQVEHGEFIALLGPNGAGKTTTLKILSGILRPSGGQVSVLGYNPFRRRSEFLRQIGFLMGSKAQLWWDLPPMDTFLLNQAVYDVSSSEFRKQMHLLPEVLGVESLLNTPVRKLSLGERMKMEIIASLLHSPSVLFLDEPTIGLDLVSQDAIRQFLRSYNREKSATIVLTSHYIRDIEDLSSRIILLNKGRKIFDGCKSSMLDLYESFRLVVTGILAEPPPCMLVERSLVLGQRMRHIVKMEKVNEFMQYLQWLGCVDIEMVKINLEEAIKLLMQDEA